MIHSIRLLEALKDADIETHLVFSSWAEKTIAIETSYTLEQVKSLASVVHSTANQAARISSGSFITDGMIIAPCSMKTLASVSYGLADNLLSRSADVVLKERQKCQSYGCQGFGSIRDPSQLIKTLAGIAIIMF